MSRFGKCSRCETDLKPLYFLEKEYNKNNLPTGRKRWTVSCLMCPSCFKKECADDIFDEPWK